ncbi:ribosomal protein L1/ribosomal biogenesis protein [Pilobolus umbonatus]|nr:ribosomal protein L1/ribosomal biogenesis protein [Pilobolus umbonatus]
MTDIPKCPGLKSEQVKKAISALRQWVNKNEEEDQLISSDAGFYVDVSVKTISAHEATKARRISVKHSLKEEGISVVLIAKNTEEETLKELKKANFVFDKIVSVKDFKVGEYRPFEARRKLSDSYDRFVVDDRIIHLVPQYVGKTFTKSLKYPMVPIDIVKGNLKKEVESALHDTYLNLNGSNKCSVKIGDFSMKDSELYENFESAVPAICNIMTKNQWSQVQRVDVRHPRTPSLPVYYSLSTEEDYKTASEQS